MSEPDDPIHSGSTRVVPPAGSDTRDSGPSNLLPVGTRLGEFEITGLIGEGGFGIVYAARDHLLEREVAIKEYMPQALASRSQGMQVSVKSDRHTETFQTGLRSFVNEAKLLAQFDHASLVKVYRFWEANGTAYMVMPLYRGDTLRGALKTIGGPPSEAWMRQLLGPLCEALETIHAEHCYHRDIAPDNILILPNGRPLLLDFGAARRVIGDMTQALTVILKPGYAPVEQYANGPEMRQGPWTDVYALAAVVYYCITGRAPVPSVSRMMKDTLAPAREVGRGIYSERFLAAVDHALAVTIEDRTASIAQFRDEIGPDPAALSQAPGMYGDVPATAASPTGGLAATRTHAPTQPGASASLDDDDDRTRVAAPHEAAAALAAARAAARTSAAGAAAPPAPTPPAAPAATPASPPGAAERDSSGRTARTAITVAGAVAVFALAIAGWMVTRQSTEEPGTAHQAPTAAAPAGAAAPAAPAAGAPPAPASAATTSPAPAPSAAPSVAQPRPFAADTVLVDVHAAREPGWDVRVQTDATTVRIGKDQLRFRVSSERAGYVYILMVGTDSSHFYQLFPNSLDTNNRITAGGTLQLPRPGWMMVAGGPPGTNRFLAIVAPSPRDFSGAGLKPGKPFAEFDLSAAAVAFATAGPAVLAGSPVNCRLSPEACDSFGSAMFEIREAD
jgi:hypothetical protein